MFVIRNAHDDQLFWSNSHGWVESPDEDYFTQDERKTLMLPFDGVWVYAALTEMDICHD